MFYRIAATAVKMAAAAIFPVGYAHRLSCGEQIDTNQRVAVITFGVCTDPGMADQTGREKLRAATKARRALRSS